MTMTMTMGGRRYGGGGRVVCRGSLGMGFGGAMHRHTEPPRQRPIAFSMTPHTGRPRVHALPPCLPPVVGPDHGAAVRTGGGRLSVAGREHRPWVIERR